VIVILLLCLLFATGRSLAQWAAGESDPETAR
jgi:hypothetical protein